MSRLQRLDYHGAIHLVHVRGKEGFNIYFDASVLNHAAVVRWSAVPHVLRFFKLLDECCSECGAQLFGYCMEPNDASLLLRTMGAPLDACMQRLDGRYSRYLHVEHFLPQHVYPFAARYESKVLAPEYLPHALRRVHARALRTGLARRAVDYPFCSAPAYVGARAPVHLETDAVWRALERKGMFGLPGYLEFMEQPETPHVTELFEQGSPLDSRVVGGNLFVAQAQGYGGASVGAGYAGSVGGGSGEVVGDRAGCVVDGGPSGGVGESIGGVVCAALGHGELARGRHVVPGERSDAGKGDTTLSERVAGVVRKEDVAGNPTCGRGTERRERLKRFCLARE